jgi:hypothetical protein
MLTNQANSTTLSSSVITVKRPYYPSRLQITNRSFYQYAPVLWNALPKQLLDDSGHLGILWATGLYTMSNCLPFYLTKRLKSYLLSHSFPP